MTKRLRCLLYHPFLFTKKLKTADLTSGTFYKEWKKLIFMFTQINGALANTIKTLMERRKKVLLDNDVLLGAVQSYFYHFATGERKKAVIAIALNVKEHQEKH